MERKKWQKHTREEIWVLRDKINKFAQEGHTFLWIATKLGLKSEALARYHFKQFRESEKGRELPPVGLDEQAPDWVGRK